MQNQNQFSEMNPESLINLFEKINFFIKEYSKLYGLTEEMSNLLPFIEKLSKDIKGYENILELLNKDKEFSILCKKSSHALEKCIICLEKIKLISGKEIASMQELGHSLKDSSDFINIKLKLEEDFKNS